MKAARGIKVSTLRFISRVSASGAGFGIVMSLSKGSSTYSWSVVGFLVAMALVSGIWAETGGSND
jgi:hypothetical protein